MRTKTAVQMIDQAREYIRSADVHGSQTLRSQTVSNFTQWVRRNGGKYGVASTLIDELVAEGSVRRVTVTTAAGRGVGQADAIQWIA